MLGQALRGVVHATHLLRAGAGVKVRAGVRAGAGVKVRVRVRVRAGVRAGVRARVKEPEA